MQGGTFPLTTTLILRLNNLIQGSNAAALPKMAVETLLDLPQLAVSHGSVSSNREQTRHFTRFAIEYLRRCGLLEEDGTPMTLYGVTSVLYPEEPSNFAFAALLRSGELHKVASGLKDRPDETMQEILLVLAWLFGRVHRRKQSPDTRRVMRNSNWAIVLPPLPPRIRNVLDVHQRAITSIFSTYAQEYAEQNADKLGAEDALPLSERSVPASASSDGAFASKLRQSELSYESRSPFAATSGHADDFASTMDLARTARAGVMLYQHAVPELAFPPLDSNEHDLDAYVIDFMKHGSLDVLIRESSLARGEVWFALQEFDRALGAIHAAFKTLYDRNADGFEADVDVDDARDAKEERGFEDDNVRDRLVRPPGCTDDDWYLYQCIDNLYNDFHARFLAIFA